MGFKLNTNSNIFNKIKINIKQIDLRYSQI